MRRYDKEPAWKIESIAKFKWAGRIAKSKDDRWAKRLELIDTVKEDRQQDRPTT